VDLGADVQFQMGMGACVLCISKLGVFMSLLKSLGLLLSF